MVEVDSLDEELMALAAEPVKAFHMSGRLSMGETDGGPETGLRQRHFRWQAVSTPLLEDVNPSIVEDACAVRRPLHRPSAARLAAADPSAVLATPHHPAGTLPTRVTGRRPRRRCLSRSSP